jgi:hypothetical protein
MRTDLTSEGEQRSLKMLNSNEILALSTILDVAIVRSKEEDDGDPIFHEVNFKDVNPFSDARTQSDVYDILASKGFIACSIFEDVNGSEEFVCITPQGLEALKSASGTH